MNSTFSDGLAVAFGNQYSNSVVVGEDATKLLNPGENFGIERDGNYLSIEKRKMPLVNDSIPIKMLGSAPGKYVLRFHSNNYSAVTNVKLIMFDAYSETETEISPLSNQYISFELGSEAQSKSPARFKLIYRDATAQTLPVTISNLSAEVKDNKTKLNWTMSNTESLQWYEVERSANGSTFYSIFKVNAGSITGENMSYTDANPLNSAAYYRIKVTEDGKTHYSAVVKAEVKKTLQVKCYPNPLTGNKLFVEVNGIISDATANVQLVNSYGCIIYQVNVVLRSNAAQLIQVPAGMQKGSYFLTIKTQEQVYTTPLLIL